MITTWWRFDWMRAGTMFYFACETKDELNQWLNTVMQSATAAHSQHHNDSGACKDASSVSKGNYYSETEDESWDEGDVRAGHSNTLGRRKGKSSSTAPFSSATLGRRRITVGPDSSGHAEKTSPVAASLDRKYLRFLRVAPEKQPVPTPQFRSYRKPSQLPSPTIGSANSSLNPSPTVSKPPPRPPSESKPSSPFKLQSPVRITSTSSSSSSPSAVDADAAAVQRPSFEFPSSTRPLPLVERTPPPPSAKPQSTVSWFTASFIQWLIEFRRVSLGPRILWPSLSRRKRWDSITRWNSGIIIEYYWAK